mmetsp:Transcript_19972/g.18962  ORF Transcript_19972/g.18962 Transcript_19972/m.18962 type:complete len:93 (-) Transcript_19972:36-314(-)
MYPLTVGRLHYFSMYLIGVLLGAYFEERTILREFPGFMEYKKLIPNNFFVDVRRYFFATDKELSRLRETLEKVGAQEDKKEKPQSVEKKKKK